MRLLDDTDNDALEDGVRTLLRRVAADVHEVPPAWEDLIRRDDRVVVPLRPAAARDRDGRPRWHHRPLTSVAAAALVAAAVGGAVIADRGGDGGAGGGTGQPAAEMITAVSPGDPAFDAGAAAAVWATGADDAVAAAIAYLAAAGVPTAPTDPAPATVTLRADSERTALVEWSLPGAAGPAGGTVYLRRPPAGDPGTGWMVVGAAAPGVALSEVAYDGERLSFSVDGPPAAGDLSVGLWVDGRPVPLPGGAAPGSGVPLDLGPDDVVVLRLAQVVEGGVRSLTEMALAMPEADPARPSADVASSVAAEGSATADPATGAAGADAGVTAEGGATLPGGGSLPGDVGDITDVTDPSLPLPLPTAPGVPGVSLPTPPTTLPPVPLP
ncbi:MAG TPA: hypothetical protein VFZ79_19360 [Acidimicrobiales bacterium]